MKDEMKPNLFAMSGGKKREEHLDNMKEIVKNMWKELPVMLEYFEVQAKMKRGMYDSYISQGFSPEQALALIK